MFSQIVNYIIIPTLMSAGAFGIFYLLDPKTGRKVITLVTWHSVNLYSKVTIYLENLAQSEYSDFDQDENDEKEDENEFLSYYDSTSQTSIALGHDFKEIPDEWWETNKESIDLLILEKQVNNNITNSAKLFKVFENIQELQGSDKEWNVVERQFVQIELEQNGKIIDIHKHLDHFYLKGNKLLTKTFLKWYLNHWYSVELADDYALKIFDKDVNLITVGPEEYILITEDGYDIKKFGEEDSDDTTDTNYEGATEE